MNDLHIFQYDRRQVRTINKNGELWFVASDVCQILALTNTTESIRAIDQDDRSTLRISEGGPEVNIINESGLYTLILRSSKQEAKRFKKWITAEVLPSIRKTGTYSIPQNDTSILANAVLVAQRVIEEQKSKLLQLEPKGRIFDQCMSSEDAIDMGIAAKMLGTGRTRLFSMLRDSNILMDNNVPYQDYTHHFKIIEQPWKDKQGNTHIGITTKIRQSGLQFIARKFGLIVTEAA